MAARHRFINNQVAKSTDLWSKGKEIPSQCEFDANNQTSIRLDEELQALSVASRDRTNEFSAVLKSIKARQSNGSRLPVQSKTPLLQRTEFSKYAKHVGKDLAKTYEKLEKLALLCKERTPFDDRPIEIKELTYIVKQDITSLKRQIQQLEDTKSGAKVSMKRDVQRHTTSVVRTLRSKLANLSENFKLVLETRRENMNQQRPSDEQHNSSNRTAIVQPLATPFTQGPVLRRVERQPNNPAGAVAISMEGGSFSGGSNPSSQYQTSELVERQNKYITERADVMDTIETTIVELGNIFQQLSTMVKEQEEQVTRIDSNVGESELNIDVAHSEILKYFHGISSNRWLMIKVFLILIAFFLVFVVFFA